MKATIKGKNIKEIYEDFYGNLWFVTKIENERSNFGYVRLYNMPEFAEFGCFPNLKGLREEIGENKVWKVDKNNWDNINSYEDNLIEVGK